MNRRSFLRTAGGAAWGAVVGGDNPVAAASHRQSGSRRGPATGRIVDVDASPAPVRLDTARTAVLVVDMQNDFGSIGGSLQRAGIDVSTIRAAIPPTRRTLDAARRSGLPVNYLKLGFQADLSDAGALDSPNYRRHQRLGLGESIQAPGGTAGRVFIRDTWNTDILTESG